MACLALPFFAEIASVDDEPAADFKFDPIELKTYQDGALDGAFAAMVASTASLSSAVATFNLSRLIITWLLETRED